MLSANGAIAKVPPSSVRGVLSQSTRLPKVAQGFTFWTDSNITAWMVPVDTPGQPRNAWNQALKALPDPSARLNFSDVLAVAEPPTNHARPAR